MIRRRQIENLRFENLTVGFGEKKSIIEEATCDIPVGRVVQVKSGAGLGKSTIVKLLNGLLQPTSGRVLINGEDIGEMTFEEFLPYRRNIGYSFDYGGLINNRTIYGNLALPLEYHNWLEPAEIHKRVSTYLDLFNLQEVANERPSAVVGGQRKATCVARALIMEPDLLLLDDPATGLRAEVLDKLKNYILEKRKEGIFKTVVFTTENHDLAKSLGDEVIELRDRKLYRVTENRGAA